VSDDLVRPIWQVYLSRDSVGVVYVQAASREDAERDALIIGEQDPYDTFDLSPIEINGANIMTKIPDGMPYWTGGDEGEWVDGSGGVS